MIFGRPPIPEEVTDAIVTQDEWDGTHEYSFQTYQWQEHAGANRLLGARSLVNDTLLLLNGANQRKARIFWDVPRSINDFENLSVKLHYDGESISARFSEVGDTFWRELDVTENGAETQVRITRALRESEAKEVSFVGFRGQRESLQMEFRDVQSAITSAQGLQNFVQVKIEVRGFLWLYHTVYEGVVSPKYVHTDRDRILVDLGGLSDQESDFASGKKLRVQVRLTRHMGDRSVGLDYKIKQKI